MRNDLVDPFTNSKSPVETIFQATAEMEYIGQRYKKQNEGLTGETFTEQLQYNYIRPSFWERLQILFFGVPPHKILRKKSLTEAELVISSLEYEPSKWKLDKNGQYTIDHENGVKIWIANGASYIRYYDCKQVGSDGFSREEQKAIYDAVRDWKVINGAKNTLVWDQNVAEYAKARRVAVGQ